MIFAVFIVVEKEFKIASPKRLIQMRIATLTLGETVCCVSKRRFRSILLSKVSHSPTKCKCIKNEVLKSERERQRVRQRRRTSDALSAFLTLTRGVPWLRPSPHHAHTYCAHIFAHRKAVYMVDMVGANFEALRSTK